VVDPDARGAVDVSLSEGVDGWTLTVRDDGIGMDEEILVRGLMDFGSSGWRSGMVRRKFPGLVGRGFRPKGHFGIGFFSVFMLGDRVEVVSRRYDQGHADARRSVFDGLASRPLVTALEPGERAPAGTTVSVREGPPVRPGRAALGHRQPAARGSRRTPGG
jgi:HSP90 family molecular chaperone